MIKRFRGNVKREYINDKQKKELRDKKILKVKKMEDGKQIPWGVSNFIKETGMDVKNTGFSNLNKEDIAYNAKKVVGDFFTELFFKTLFTKDEIYFLYIILNGCYREVAKTDLHNILIKGGVVLSIFRENLHEQFKKNIKNMDQEKQDLCQEFIEETKSKVADLDVIVPYPDEWENKNEKILALGYNVYKKFGSYFKTDGLISKLANEFVNQQEVLDILKIRLEGEDTEERNYIREQIMLSLGIDKNDKTLEFDIEPTGSFSSYTRQLEDFFSESYKIDPEGKEMLLTCACVEGIVMPTSKITPLVFNLCRIIMNFKITCKEKGKEARIKLTLVDMPFESYSNLKHSTEHEVNTKLSREEMNTIKENMYKDKLIENKIHTISINTAVNEHIRDMLYRRNYFVFEDTKYEKRLKRDIIYNSILLYKKCGILRTKKDLETFKEKIMFISECAEDSTDWVNCIYKESSKQKDVPTVFVHIMKSIESMSGILLLPEKERPEYIDYGEYISDFRIMLDQLIIIVDFTLLLFTTCSDLF